MSVGLIFTSEGCYCFDRNNTPDLTKLFKEQRINTIPDYHQDDLQQALQEHLGGRYQEMLTRFDHKPVWKNFIYDKVMVHPWINPISRNILGDTFGDVGEIYGHVILTE